MASLRSELEGTAQLPPTGKEVPEADLTDETLPTATRLATLDITTDAGLAQLRLVKPCPRCPIPNVDPATGLSSPEVGDMLQSFRADVRLNGAVTFGMNATVVGSDGDDADVLELVLRVGQRVSGHYRFG